MKKVIVPKDEFIEYPRVAPRRHEAGPAGGGGEGRCSGPVRASRAQHREQGQGTTALPARLALLSARTGAVLHQASACRLGSHCARFAVLPRRLFSSNSLLLLSILSFDIVRLPARARHSCLNHNVARSAAFAAGQVLPAWGTFKSLPLVRSSHDLFRQEKVQGMIIITSKGPFEHKGITLSVEGSASLSLRFVLSTAVSRPRRALLLLLNHCCVLDPFLGMTFHF